MASLITFAGHRLGLLVIFAGGAYSLGKAVLRGLAMPSSAERFSLRLAVGLGALSFVFFLLACVNALTSLAVVGVLTGSYALAAFLVAVSPERLPAATRTSAGLVRALGMGAVLLPLLLSTLYPLVDADSTMYHLPAAAAFAHEHSLAPLEGLRYPVFPQLSELLVAGTLLIGQDPLTPLLNALWCLLVAGTLAAWSSRLGNHNLAIWSTSLWLASPIVWVLVASGHVELCLAAFVTAGLFAFDVWLRTGERGWLLVAGALSGWGAATKYTGLFFVAALGVALAFVARRAERPRALAAFLSLALLTGGPWYLRSALLTGDPFWPFLGQFFGYRFWNRGDVSSVVWSLRRMGGPPTLLAFLQLPWTLTFHQPRGSQSLTPLLFILFTPGAIWCAVRRRTRWLPLVGLGFVCFWFVTTRQMRFLVSGVPAIAFVGAIGAKATLNLVFRHDRRISLLATAVSVTALLGPRVYGAWTQLARSGPPPSEVGSRDEYLAERLPSYALYTELNRRTDGNYTVYAFHDEPMKFFCSGTLVGDWFGRGRYRDLDLSSGQSLYMGLKRLGADFLLVNSSIYQTPLPRDPFFDRHFVPIFSRDWIAAFQLQ